MDELETLAPAPDTAAQPESSPAPEPAKSVSDALDNAFDNVFSDEPEMQSGRLRDEQGRFAAKQAAEAKAQAQAQPEQKPAEQAKPDAPINIEEPPARLSNEAKAEWARLPPAVKADVHRTIREMEGGIEKYRGDATRYQSEIAPYEQLAQQYGMDVKGVLADYEGMARMMAQNPIQVFDTLAKRHGFTLQDLAANVLNMDLDDYAKQTAAEITRLQQENMELRRQTQTYTQKQQQEVQSFIADFAVKNPRYAELEPQIAGILRSPLVTAQDPQGKLQQAYNIAVRLNPGPEPAPVQNPALAAQTRKGQLSVTGAPGTGSNPANRKTPASAREALDRAFDQFGL